MINNVKEEDFGKSYKTFKDLKDGDPVFKVNYETLSIERCEITNFILTNISNSLSHNLYKVEFIIPGDNHSSYEIMDANNFIYETGWGNNLFITTDERIATMMIRLLERRADYQWNAFTSLFGNPLGGYAQKPVLIR